MNAQFETEAGLRHGLHYPSCGHLAIRYVHEAHLTEIVGPQFSAHGVVMHILSQCPLAPVVIESDARRTCAFNVRAWLKENVYKLKKHSW